MADGGSVLPGDWLDRYLARIGASRPLRPDLTTLVELTACHGRTVPFENLDIVRGRAIELGTARTIEKIAIERRGGFCFEVNEAFRVLLAGVGFNVRRIEGRVWVEDAQAFGAPFDHLALVVALEDADYLVDVDFGDNNPMPLRLPDGESLDVSGRYRLHRGEGDRLVLERRQPGGVAPRALDEMTMASRSLAEFEPMCRYHQSSADSMFTKGPICTMATATGRITMSRNRVVEWCGTDRRDTDIADEATRSALLKRHFGIDLDARR